MSSFGQIELRDVMAMLRECAPDHTVKEYTHSLCIMLNGLTFPTFPKKRQVDIGQVRKMAKELRIIDCAKGHIQSI